MERGEWGKLKEPSLLLSNHPPLWEMVRLLKDVSKFSNEGEGIEVVMDAVFLKAAGVFLGLEGIPVDVNRSMYKSGSSGAYQRSMMVRRWGEVSGVYDKAFGGVEVVKRMREVLDSGRSVLLCPSGTGSVDARWRSGVGYLIKGIYEDGAEDDFCIGFISIARNGYVLLSFSSMVELFGRDFIEETVSNRQLVAEMQNIFEGLLMVV